MSKGYRSFELGERPRVWVLHRELGATDEQNREWWCQGWLRAWLTVEGEWWGNVDYHTDPRGYGGVHHITTHPHTRIRKWEDGPLGEKSEPPWTPEQVASLNDFQRWRGMHPFTCAHRGAVPHQRDVLIAVKNGWLCPDCDYTQYWAHEWMVDGTWRAWEEEEHRVFGASRRDVSDA